MIFKYCPDCGQNLEATFKFCPSCGFKIPKGENEEEVQPVTFHSTSSSAQTEPSPKAPNSKCSPVKLISPKKEIASPKRKRESDLSTQKSPVKSPLAAKSPKGKRQKNNPLELNIENEILTDQNNKKWKLIRLLSQHETESGLLLYNVLCNPISTAFHQDLDEDHSREAVALVLASHCQPDSS
ncbi:inactive serine/threonine-protein kinase VRK3-like isoform X2 [Hypanus sabinus]|uniref:inactive serine/threonine-protein kinase VRK3-like isoform X2 n=1 Tax=Hypanus sabinus TaxID=79690 RepID=UPI0028C423C6|nr:inactive serine/threonine-protein kinase VRK3-like isoform X2 [Hypanus sabinus]